MIEHKKLMAMWVLLFLNINVLNILVKCENTNLMKICERDGNSIENIANLVLNVASKTIIECRFSFDISGETTRLNVTEESTNSTDLYKKPNIIIIYPSTFSNYPTELEDEKRLQITKNSTINDNHLIVDIVFNISQAGLKHQGSYLIYFNHSNENILGANFSIQINALGNHNDKCQFVDQCSSSRCANGLCVCNQEYPVYHDKECLHAKNLSDACLITEQCQYGGHQEISCEAIEANNSNKSCRCQPNYIFLQSHPKCLLPKNFNESCEISEQCQSYDEKSFCSADLRCQCIIHYTTSKNGCVKRENAFRYDILIAVIVSSLLSVIITIVIYKYYNNIALFIIGLKKRGTAAQPQPQQQLQIDAQRAQSNSFPVSNSSSNITQPRQIERLVFKKKTANDNEINDEFNIYDDVAEIRYVAS